VGVVSALAGYGASVIDTRAGKPADPRFSWNFIGPVVSALNGPQRDVVIQELYDAAFDVGHPMSIIGAHGLLSEWDPRSRDGRCLELQDAFLAYMHEHGYSSGHLNRYEADRWIELHGDLRSSFDGIVEVTVPGPAEAPPAAELEPGAHKLLAQLAPMPPLPKGNAFYVERRPDGAYVLFSERWSSERASLVRCEENDLGSAFTSMSDALRALGEMLQFRPHWADATLDPYFPSRRG
jgi:hypothetical protein